MTFFDLKPVKLRWHLGALFGLLTAAACSLGTNLPEPGHAAGKGGSSGSSGASGAGKGGTVNAGGSGSGTAGSSNGGTSGKGAGGSAGTAMAGGGAGGQAGSNSSGGDSGNTNAGKGGASGGAGGSSGAMSTGGMSAGGTSAGGSAGGGGAGGTSGSAGSGTGGGLAGPPDPSAGCGKANPQTGSSGSPLNVSNHQYYVKLPTAYDASKPYMVIMMFNPTGNPLSWAEQSAGFESNGAKDGAIRVYPGPLSMASGWGSSDVGFFRPFYDKITADYCIDKARVFAFGESSGGDFVSILGCEYADVIRGVGPGATKNVSDYPLDVSRRDCVGQVTSVVIHGKNDNVVGPENGPKTRDFYTALNHCGTTSTPVMGYTDTLSNCVEYEGCDAGYPVFWCQHTDPEYSNTNHGWPHFAAKFLWDMFSKY